ncbi:hypothetical protein [Oceanibium sediminis]|uniref:hypothetical protein n=1 Tax=Oceanibium sediminis TaxID=2026339 RepID=UPI00130019F5|nr:hypothetical protein [Oceanibium sediminis]
MLFEWIEFLGWGWLIAAHIAAFGLLFLPFLVSPLIEVVERNWLARPATSHAREEDPPSPPT